MQREDVGFPVEGDVTLRGWLLCRRGPVRIRVSRWPTAMPGCVSMGWSDSPGCSLMPGYPLGQIRAAVTDAESVAHNARYSSLPAPSTKPPNSSRTARARPDRRGFSVSEQNTGQQTSMEGNNYERLSLG